MPEQRTSSEEEQLAALKRIHAQGIPDGIRLDEQARLFSEHAHLRMNYVASVGKTAVDPGLLEALCQFVVDGLNGFAAIPTRKHRISQRDQQVIALINSVQVRAKNLELIN